MSLAAHHDVRLFNSSKQPGSDPNSRSTRTTLSHICSPPVVPPCYKHPEERLRFFCKTCQRPVCRDCILTTHKRHYAQDIADATLVAKKELSEMLSQLQQQKDLLEKYRECVKEYRAQFEQQSQHVREMIKTVYSEVKTAIDASFQKLAEDLEKIQKTEMKRIRSKELAVQNNIQDVTRLLHQQSINVDSSIHDLSQHEFVSVALKTLSNNIKEIELPQGEFFIYKNPRLATIARDFLSRVTFAAGTLPHPQSNENVMHGQTVIREISPRRELAFNINEPSTGRTSVKSMVATYSGAVWVATQQSLLQVRQGQVRRESGHMPDNIAGLAAGPGDKLLVSLGQGSSIKVYAHGSWSHFASMPKGNMLMASRLEQDSLRVYLAVTSQSGSMRIVSYSTKDQVCQQITLPAHLFSNGHGQKRNSAERAPAAANSSSTSAPPLRSSPTSSAPRYHSSFTSPPSAGLRLTCLTVGWEGWLYLGDAGGRRLLILDSEGRELGQYLGPDGHSGCSPCSICIMAPGQVVMADSERCTVELLSPEGRLLAPLLSRDNLQDSRKGGGGVPTCVTVDDRHRLWVGTSSGSVYAFTLLRTCP